MADNVITYGVYDPDKHNGWMILEADSPPRCHEDKVQTVTVRIPAWIER